MCVLLPQLNAVVRAEPYGLAQSSSIQTFADKNAYVLRMCRQGSAVLYGAVRYYAAIQGAQKRTNFKKCVTPVCDDVGRRSTYVQFFIRIKSDILNVAIFKYSLHKIRETILYRKYQLI